MLKEQIEKKIEYLEGLNTTDERVVAKLEELHMFPNEQVEIKNIQKKTNQLKR